MSAEGSQIQQLGPTDDIVSMLRQQGVQPTPANMSAALQAMLAQQQNATPVSPVMAPQVPQTRSVARASVVPAQEQNERRGDVLKEPIPYQNERRGDIPTIAVAQQPVAGSSSMSDIIGAALAAAGLGGLAYAGRKGAGSNAAFDNIKVNMPQSSMLTEPSTPTKMLPGLIDPAAAQQMRSSMPVESSMPKGPSSQLAPASNVASSEPQMVNAKPPVPQATPQQLADALKGTNISNIDWSKSGIGDLFAIPPVPGGTAVENGPIDELRALMKKHGVTPEQLPDHMRPVFTNPEAARVVADRPKIWQNMIAQFLWLARR